MRALRRIQSSAHMLIRTDSMLCLYANPLPKKTATLSPSAHAQYWRFFCCLLPLNYYQKDRISKRRYLMFKKAFVLLSILPLTAMAAPVAEGTYVSGSHKRVHLSSFDYEGSKHYELFLANMIGDSSFITASKAKLIQDNQIVVFTAPENRYLDYQSNLGCQVEVTFSPSEIQLKNLNNCTSIEKAFNGSYVYSKQSSVVPQKYQGAWGDCDLPKAIREPAFLSANRGSSNGVQRFDVIKVDPISSNVLNVTGAFYYESNPVVDIVRYEYLADKSVRIKAGWNDSASTYKKCRD